MSSKGTPHSTGCGKHRPDEHVPINGAVLSLAVALLVAANATVSGAVWLYAARCKPKALVRIWVP